MCNPAVAVMAVGVAIQAGSTIADHAAQNAAAKKNKAASNRAAQADLDALATREGQEQQVALGNILSIEQEVAQASATASVNAGEAGVSGASVLALLSIINTRGTEAVQGVQQGFKDTKDQIRREGEGVRATRESRINAVPRASAVQTGLKLGATALDGYTAYRGTKPIANGGG